MTEELIKSYGVPVAILVVNAGALLGLWRKASSTRTEISGDNSRRAADRNMQESLARGVERIRELETLVEAQRSALLEAIEKKHLAETNAAKYKERYRLVYSQMPSKTKNQKVLADAYKPTNFGDLGD